LISSLPGGAVAEEGLHECHLLFAEIAQGGHGLGVYHAGALVLPKRLFGLVAEKFFPPGGELLVDLRGDDGADH
jgi:hypothetical protein